MAYILPRAIIVLIAWGATCLVMNIFTRIAPQIFYAAAGVWSLVGLVCFSYMHGLRGDTRERPVRVWVKARTAAE